MHRKTRERVLDELNGLDGGWFWSTRTLFTWGESGRLELGILGSLGSLGSTGLNSIETRLRGGRNPETGNWELNPGTNGSSGERFGFLVDALFDIEESLDLGSRSVLLDDGDELRGSRLWTLFDHEYELGPDWVDLSCPGRTFFDGIGWVGKDLEVQCGEYVRMRGLARGGVVFLHSEGTTASIPFRIDVILFLPFPSLSTLV